MNTFKAKAVKLKDVPKNLVIFHISGTKLQYCGRNQNAKS